MTYQDLYSGLISTFQTNLSFTIDTSVSYGPTVSYFEAQPKIKYPNDSSLPIYVSAHHYKAPWYIMFHYDIVILINNLLHNDLRIKTIQDTAIIFYKTFSRETPYKHQLPHLTTDLKDASGQPHNLIRYLKRN